MKRIVLLFTVWLTGLTAVVGTEKIMVNSAESFDNPLRYGYAEPIVFMERGIEFLIFPDGSFDFNTEVNTYGNVYYKNSTGNRTRRSTVNSTYGAPAYHHGGGVLITHDNQGKVRRIGNVFINYDRSGKIKRAGSVYMSYNRGNGRLTQVGGLRVHYNAWGNLVNSSGFVNHESLAFNTLAPIHSSNVVATNFYYEDEDFYYYKNDKKVRKKK